MGDWQFSHHNNHYYHTLGLSVYIDPVATPSGAIRALGPWVPLDLDPQEVVSLMAPLVRSIEDEYSTNYVVFGSYSEYVEFDCHSFPVSGFECGFVPSIKIRSCFLGSSKKMSQEWIANGILHRSGLGVKENRTLDLMVLHPKTVRTDLEMFRGSRTIRDSVASFTTELFQAHALDSVA